MGTHASAIGHSRSPGEWLPVDPDRELFLEVLADTVKRFGWICHAYVTHDQANAVRPQQREALPTTYHLPIEAPEANLSRGILRPKGVDMASRLDSCVLISERSRFVFPGSLSVPALWAEAPVRGPSD